MYVRIRLHPCSLFSDFGSVDGNDSNGIVYFFTRHFGDDRKNVSRSGESLKIDVSFSLIGHLSSETVNVFDD